MKKCILKKEAKVENDIKNKIFYIIIIFFIAGIINISFSIFGLFCMIYPFVLYIKYKDKIWCKYFCPRAGFFTVILSKISLKLKPPKWLFGETTIQFVIYYFIINTVFIIFSTVMVALHRLHPMNFLRFFMIFRVPINFPQLLSINLPNFISHFGYRVYSMMFTSFSIAVILGIIFKPRTWCGFCPIRTLTDKKTKKV